MKKHAYLILAHNEFEVLRLLLESIDDPRNDVYIHFDRKVKSLPELSMKYSQLIVVDERVDVRWGDVSIIRAEYVLWRSAFDPNRYAYYHLLSGVDLPIKSQDEIHQFFQEHADKEFIGFNDEADVEQMIERKVRRRHLFADSFKEAGLIGLTKRILRFGYLRLQNVCGWRRHAQISFKKGTQWVSITSKFVAQLLANEDEIYRIYADSFCADEIYKQTLIWNSPLRDSLYDDSDEGNGCQRMIGWRNATLYDFNSNDEERIKHSNRLFARKFNSQDMDFLKRIVRYTDEH